MHRPPATAAAAAALVIGGCAPNAANTPEPPKLPTPKLSVNGFKQLRHEKSGTGYPIYTARARSSTFVIRGSVEPPDAVVEVGTIDPDGPARPLFTNQVQVDHGTFAHRIKVKVKGNQYRLTAFPCDEASCPEGTTQVPGTYADLIVYPPKRHPGRSR